MRSADARRLFVYLRAQANTRGLAMAREGRLLAELQWPRERIDRALAELVAAGTVESLAPLPYLVLRLRSWSSQDPQPAKTEADAYSYSKLSNDQMIHSYRQPDATRLLREILDTLGETDPAPFEGALRHYSPQVIRTALDRVRRARDIRKSRTALFRHLLPRLAGDHPRTT